MSLPYIRKTYKVPAFRGDRVAWKTSKGTRYGTITRGTAYVYIRFDDSPKRSVPLHPLEDGLVYLLGDDSR